MTQANYAPAAAGVDQGRGRAAGKSRGHHPQSVHQRRGRREDRGAQDRWFLSGTRPAGQPAGCPRAARPSRLRRAAAIRRWTRI